MSANFRECHNFLSVFNTEIVKEAEVQIKYDGYIQKQKQALEKRASFHQLKIPENIDYAGITALSNEGREKLQEVKPIDMSQASLIAGVRQSDLALLLHHIKKSA